MKYIHLTNDGCNGWAHCGVVSALPGEVGDTGERGVFRTEDGEQMYVSVDPPSPPKPIAAVPKPKTGKSTREIMKAVLAKHGPLDIQAFWGMCSGKLDGRGVFDNLLKNKKKNGGDFVKTPDGKWGLP